MDREGLLLSTSYARQGHLELVFKNGVLPEIIGKCFTRVPKVMVYDNNDISNFAAVRRKSLEKYFHLECLNLGVS